ncbi:hypothetical protein C8Q74DRAFT_1450222, partial [Fomes fomentarius]
MTETLPQAHHSQLQSPHTSPRSLIDVFSCHLISDRVLHQLDPRSLALVACVSRMTQQATQDYRRRAFNINKRLERFFSNPPAFRSLQATTAAIISGSFAVQFFDRSFYPESDLDIYVHPDAHVRDIALYLLSEGYTYQPTEWQQLRFEDELDRLWATIEPESSDGSDSRSKGDTDSVSEDTYGLSSLLAVWNFNNKVSPDGEDKRNVDVIVAQNSPLESVLDFHS